MEIYQVGGSVRDKLMGVSSQDIDWVVVGACANDLLEQGYLQVGADFPVFLHPQTQDEYALARTERKSGAGYLGFEVDVENVTLEEDLMRRDLTINAMALAQDGTLIDPYNGKSDLENKALRHVGVAFTEDPVRILRVLRFLARFGPGWTIAPETKDLIARMVANGEASALVPERIWKETARALMEPYPQQYFSGLKKFGLDELPCFHSYRFTSYATDGLNAAARRGLSFNTRAALALGHPAQAKACPPGTAIDTWKAILAWSEFGSDLDLLSPAQHSEKVITFLERIGAFKGGDLLKDVLSCWNCVGLDVSLLHQASLQACFLGTKSITNSMPPGPAVGKAIQAARRAAMLAE